MNNSNPGADDWASNSTRNTIRLAGWTAAWLLTTALAQFGPKLIWGFNTALTVGAVLLNLAMGIMMIMANRKHLQGLDEMQRKIFMDAAAVTLGVGLVCGVSYKMLQAIKLITTDPNISNLIMLMAVTFIIATLIGNRNYR